MVTINLTVIMTIFFSDFSVMIWEKYEETQSN